MNRQQRWGPSWGGVGLLTALVVWLVAGCAGPGGSSNVSDAGATADDETPPVPGLVLSEESRELARGALSAVEITGHGLATIEETVNSVFVAAGFEVSPAGKLVFERPGSRADRVAYGTWFEQDVRIRMRVEILNQGRGRHLVLCRSFVVRGSGGSTEDEQKLARRRVREYEGLLTEVASRLN